MNKEETDEISWLSIIMWILTLAFVNMKLMGWIAWPWVLVLSPVLFYIGFVIAIIIILYLNGY